MSDVIAITCSLGTLSKNFNSPLPPPLIHQLSSAYVDAVERAGGIALLLPSSCNPAMVEEALSRVDGLLLPGGGDLDPTLYGQRPVRELDFVQPRYDAFELAAVRVALSAQMPVLGICRGMQVLNVALGGSLYQDLEKNGYLAHQLSMFPREAVTHRVKLLGKSRLAEAVGTQDLGVNSFHHQGICRLASGLIETAWSQDGVIEAFELPGNHFMMGVQWHPECMSDSTAQQNVFGAFLKACSGACAP
ncbi:MAG: gamma-glutamyl-gamma-aminobutyrate hydrolase family protein [Pygmaiobacter sp.]